MRVAVASKEGIGISEHFGHAKQFWIYDVEHGFCKLVEHRQVEHYCLGGTSNKSALHDILETIKDCEAVFVARIGEGPTQKLEAAGIVAVDEFAYESINSSLLEFAHNYTKLDTL